MSLIWLHPNALLFRARKPLSARPFEVHGVHDHPIARLRQYRQLEKSNQTTRPVSFCWLAALLLDSTSPKLAMGCIIPA